MLIPIYWLLLGLASLTGVAPPPDVPRDRMVLVTTYPEDGSNVAAYWCGAGVGPLDPWCPSGRGIKAGDLTVSDRLWSRPLTMQHAATHEVGHLICGADEYCAEAYACRWVPMHVVAYDMHCRPDGWIYNANGNLYREVQR